MTKPQSVITSCNGLIQSFNAKHKAGLSWTQIGRESCKEGISGAMAWRIANDGYEPKRADIRKKLGLPLLSPAPMCPTHGVVHLTKRCPSDKPRKPRAKKSRWFDGNYPPSIQ